jgi:dihydropyrimidinase
VNTQTLIKHATVVRPEGLLDADVLILDDKISAVEQGLPIPPEARVIDADGCYLFPGVIDPHTHMGVPIKDGWSADDFRSGSRAALLGGVTTMLDFTHLEPNETLQDSIDRRRQQAAASHADFGLHVNVTRTGPSILNEIQRIAKQGITSFKVFTTYREAGMMLGYGEIERVAEAVQGAGGLLMVHAEDDEVIRGAESRLDSSSPDPVLHGLSRPAEAERRAVERLAGIAERTGCPVYIVHLSSAEGLEAARRTKGTLTLETCPQYLLLDESCYQRNDGRMFVASPPLRTVEDNKLLFEALIAGEFLTIGTDHCPFNIADKPEGTPYGQIPNGIGGVETLLPIMLARFIQQDLPLTRLAAVMAENPASVFGLRPRKGRIEANGDADLLLIHTDDLNPSGIAIPHESAADWTAFAGMPVLYPRHVWRRGEHVVSGGSLSGELGKGSFMAVGSA